jgi:hypothetical protein
MRAWNHLGVKFAKKSPIKGKNLAKMSGSTGKAV